MKKTLVISIISYFHIFTFSHCAAYAAPVLDGGGIRLEFESEERGFDCLSIKNKLNGKDVQFGDGASDGNRVGLWAVWMSDKGKRRAFIVNISGEERRFEFKVAPNAETHSVTLPPRSVCVK